MSEIKVTVLDAGEPAERAVTTGTKAWELFADDPQRHRGPGRRRAARPRARARRRRRRRGRRDRPPGRPRHPAALDRARDGAGGAGAVPRGQARHRPADHRRLLLRLRRRRPRSCPRTSRRSRRGCARSSRRASGSRAGRSPTTTRASELADEPYKLELIGLKGGAGDVEDAAEGAERRGRRRRADHLRQPQARRLAGLEGPLPRPAPADHQAHPGVQADALAPRRTGAATRRTSSCSASTAPPGSPRRRSRSTCTGSRRPSGATTASSGRDLDLYSLPRRARLRPGRLPPQGRRDQARDGGLRPPAAHRGGLRVRRHPAHLQGGAVPHLRAPAVLRRRRCSRRWRWRARTTTSRR